MLDNAVAVTSGKGGVLKTTISCHLAGIAAARGMKVLLVDADPQGNAMFDLGYQSDGGQDLSAALIERRSVRPLEEIRPGLDVVCGGPELDKVASQVADKPEEWYRLEDTLLKASQRYDLIVIDAPAREMWVRHMILTAARFLVIPSAVDRASRVGLPDAARTINEVRATTNPRLDVLAVITGPIPTTSTLIRQRALDRLGELIGDPCLVCSTIVRRADLVAEQCREYGLLATEYAAMAGLPNSQRLDSDLPNPTAATSQAAQRVADDWISLVDELLTRFQAATAQEPGDCHDLESNHSSVK